MPTNENPYRPDEALHAVFENGGPEIRRALLEDFKKTQGDRYHNDLREYLTDLKDATISALDPYAATEWGKPAEQDFRCPSGQLCRVKRVDMMDLLAGGVLNDVDFLTSIVQDEHIPNASGATAKTVDATKTIQALAGDEGRMSKFRETIDKVVLRIVVRPQLWPVPPVGEARVDGCVYVDSISMFDRIALFNWAVTGKEAEELKQFRDSPESVGSVEPGKNVRTETVELPSNPLSS